MTYETKPQLLERGISLAEEFCMVNDLPMPVVRERPADKWPYGACAYYRAHTIAICTAKCAAIGVAGRAWSYPGYTVDRTPYGVIQHELGHHVDFMRGTEKGAYWSEFGSSIRADVKEDPITSYCPNDAEWFAESFRLFVTNPAFLKAIRPRTYARLISEGFIPVFDDDWDERLDGAPERTLRAAANKIPEGDLFHG